MCPTKHRALPLVLAASLCLPLQAAAQWDDDGFDDDDWAGSDDSSLDEDDAYRMDGLDLDAFDGGGDAQTAAPQARPEFAGETRKAADGAPATLVVVGGSDAVAERFALDLERILTARLARTPALGLYDPDTLLLAGEGGDPETRLAEARRHAARGQEQYHNLMLDEAIESYADAVHRYVQALPALSDPGEMAAAYLMLGATHFVAGQRQAAHEAFRNALLLDPEHQPDRGLFSPPLLDAFEGARWEVSAMQAAPLTVTSRPANAEVWVNGHFRGLAPVTLEGLPVGEIHIMARQRGYVPRIETRITTPADAQTVDVNLRSGASTSLYGSYREAAVRDVPEAGIRMPESIGRLAEMFEVDRIVVGQLSSDGRGRRVQLVVYDTAAGLRITEATEDLLDLDEAGVVAFADRFLAAAAGPTPEAPEEAVARRGLPAPADDWRFWAATGAGVAVVAGTVAVIAATSGGAEAPAARSHERLIIMRIP
jgi:tetratricopeptide (TPR) repeat protein